MALPRAPKTLCVQAPICVAWAGWSGRDSPRSGWIPGIRVAVLAVLVRSSGS